MRILILATLIATGLVQAAWNGYEEVRDLSLNAEGLGSLHIEAGAGSLVITGVAGSGTIVVEALIQVPDEDVDAAREIIESGLVLDLGRDGDRAVLRGYFEDGGWLSHENGSVRLKVTVPEAMSLDVEDGSGSIVVQNMAGDVVVEDGSGSLELTRVGGSVTIADGSGSISAEKVGGDISIVDGSGSLSVLEAEGNVTIDDGSGGITVSGVAGDLDILEAGSGGLTVTDVQGRFDSET